MAGTLKHISKWFTSVHRYNLVPTSPPTNAAPLIHLSQDLRTSEKKTPKKNLFYLHVSKQEARIL